jgi:tetratricopeptide (TPR) repeat protein
MNEFLSKLRSRLRSAETADERAEILAKMAGILARLQRFDEARQTIDELRKTYADGRSGVVTVWIMVAEGLVHHYEQFRPEATDRMTRAQVLSVAMKYDPVIALASAWKAQFHFEFGVYDEMLKCLELAVKHTDDKNHDANIRMSIVLCNAFMISGDAPAAQHWFMRARRSAEKNEDRASIEALLYNRAALRITRARAENCLRAIEGDELRGIRMEVLSAVNYQALSQLASLPEHLRLWDARLKILEGEFQSALDTLIQTREEPRFAEHNFSRNYIDLEIAYCEFQVGRVDEALVIFEKIRDVSFDEFDVDEQMVAAWLRHRLAEADNRFSSGFETVSELHSATGRYEETMSSLARGLLPFAP